VLKGTLLAESLRIAAPVELTGLRLTRLVRRDVSTSVAAAQPSVWTFVEFEADDAVAEPLASSLAAALLAEGGWYADFTVADEHVIVFANRVFRYRRGDAAARREAEAYGRAVGVPDHQLDWRD
jgi:hypothetical protein